MNIYANHDLTEISFLRGWSKEEDKQTGSLGMPPLYLHSFAILSGTSTT